MKKTENNGILNINSTLYQTRLSAKFLKRKPYMPVDQKAVISVIPGTVLDILVKIGQDVRKGEELVILDSMKMQNIIKCAMDGTIGKINVNKGEKVSKGTILIELK